MCSSSPLASPWWALSLRPQPKVLPMSALPPVPQAPELPLIVSLSQRSNGFSTAVSLFHFEENYEVKLSGNQPLEIFYTEAWSHYHCIVKKNAGDFALYELFLLKDFLCCINATFINRFLQTLPLSTTDLIFTLFLCLDTMVFYDCNKNAQTEFCFCHTQYYIQIFWDVSILQRWGCS